MNYPENNAKPVSGGGGSSDITRGCFSAGRRDSVFRFHRLRGGCVVPDRPSPRQAYEDGMPIHVIRRRYHLSHSEAQDVAPEEFEDVEMGQNKTSGY